MHRGTTPTLTFTAPFALEGATKLNLVFAQDSSIVLEKGLSDVTISDKKITLALTQAETLLFDSSKKYVKMQVRIELNGKVLASNIMQADVEMIIKDGLL